MRRLVSAILMAGVAIAASAQPGGSGVTVGPMPNYFSGTNCRAYGGGQIGEPIVDAELYLNDELVHEYHHSGDPLEPYPMSMGLAVMFDSSHWPHGTTVEVKYRVRGLYTYTWQYAYGYAPTWNKALVAQHPDPNINGFLAPTLSSELQSLHYASALLWPGPWLESQYFSEMYGANVVFYTGHGNTNVHAAGNWYQGSEFLIWDVEYEAHRVMQIGSGLPPFNTGAPAVNFVHLVACHCGDTNGFLKACFPYYMGWGGPYLENQAVFAYRVLISTNEYYLHMRVVWDRMESGETAFTTLKQIRDAIGNEQLHFTVWITYDPETGEGETRSMVPDDLVLYCGPDEGACRVKTVYTGGNGPPVGWRIRI